MTAVAGILHGAPVHDGEIVAELAGKVEILFDQHDRDVAEAAKIRDRARDVLDDRWLNALGRLVKQQQFWPHHQRTPDRKLLLLAAGQIAAAAPEHRLQHRKQRELDVRNIAVLALQRSKAGLEIFLHRQQRKNLASVRHQTDALSRPLIGPETRDVDAVEGDRTAGDGILADHRAQQAGLADAVAAEHARHLARFSRERDAAQRLGGAVIEADILYFEHGSASQ